MVRVPQPIVMMDRDEFLQMQREAKEETEEQPEYENVIDDEIAELRSRIIALQADLAIKENELQALIVKTLAGETPVATV